MQACQPGAMPPVLTLPIIQNSGILKKMPRFVSRVTTPYQDNADI
jgi:hypothetical protein